MGVSLQYLYTCSNASKVRGLFLILALLCRLNGFGQTNNYCLIYSLEYELPDSVPEKFDFSSEIIVFYSENGMFRYIESSNNFIQSCSFNNDKNKLIAYDSTGITGKFNGDFNNPDFKEYEKINDTLRIFRTAFGHYTYQFYKDSLKLNLTWISNLKEHCFNRLIEDHGAIPICVLYGPFTLKLKLIPILTIEEQQLLNRAILIQKDENINSASRILKKKLEAYTTY